MKLDEAALWAAFKEQGCEAARAALILRYLPLVHETRRRVVPAVPVRIDPEDLESAGRIALIQAADRYQLARGVSFHSFLLHRLRGAMLDYLREEDWTPRSVWREQKERAEAGLSPLPVIALIPLSDLFETDGDDEPIPLADRIADPRQNTGDAGALRAFARDCRQALAALPPAWRVVMHEHYWQGRPLKEIARKLGKSRSRVDQIHTRARRRLRCHLARWEAFG